MIENLNDVFAGERVGFRDGKFINWENKKAGVGLELIGIKDSKLILIGQYNWQVYEIGFSSIENKGSLIGATLADVRDNADILLNDAKVMSVEEIEKILGHKVILKY